MRVLVACEFSRTVASAFERAGHTAMSCDILPAESPGSHYQGDVFNCLNNTWDLIIAHPPCTHMAVCGNGTWANTLERIEAQEWTRKLWDRCVEASPKVCFENPVSTLSRALPVKAQYVHPWQFGHMETKKTGLWLRNLPPLEPTDIVYDEMMLLPKKERHRVWYASPGKNRGKERSRFYTGIADAMASQWSA